MATWDDVERIALGLPETSKGLTFRTPAWKVTSKPKPKAFAWVRPLGKSDIKALTELGREAPSGELLGLRTDGMEDKQALLQTHPQFLFDIPHFRNSAALLCRLDDTPVTLLEELLVDAWLVYAPQDVAKAYLAEHNR